MKSIHVFSRFCVPVESSNEYVQIILRTTLLFADFSNAFDSIHRGKMEQILQAYNLPKETVTATMMFYKNTKAIFRSTYGDTDLFLARRYHKHVFCL